MNVTTAAPRARDREGGQSLPEFAMVLIPFLLLLLGIFDLGRGIYTYNAAAQAAREIARSASVDLQNGASVGSGAETLKIRSLQQKLVPGLTSSGIQISCVDIEDNPLTTACHSGDFVRVRVTVTYQAVTPLLGLAGPIQLVAVSHLEVA